MSSGERLQVQVLGPIRVIDGEGRDVTPDGVLQRRLLALLVLRRGHVVSVDTALDVLWPSKLPRDPVAALQNHLFRLRRGLPEGVIRSMGDGYLLDAARVDLDADRLSAGLAEAGTPEEPAPVGIEDVLERWQGPAYPELEEVDDGRAEAARLDELRLRALEARAERRLARRETDGLVADLAALADAEPLRERPRALLMAALAATGRRAEALRTYDQFRRLLADELGIEPSPALAAQHTELLLGGPADPAGTATPTAPGSPTPTPTPTPGPGSRLPVPATSLVAREGLAAELTALAEAERLVTLVGPGGVGKTRLLVEVGHRLLGNRPDRPVVLCELAGADGPTAIDVVAAALGIDARPGVPPAERIADVVDRAELVVLLDNCEHVLDPAAELVEAVLARCPNVRLLATSRERLRLAGEQVCTVPTLPADDEGSAAARLFVERARAVAPGFQPAGSDLRCIGEIVRRLDGLPLALELAAARLHTHDVAEVAAGLDHRFSLLSAGYRTSSRHGSLGAAVSWSFGLLDPELQQAFVDLSVFSGSFARADAAAVCHLDAEAAHDALAQLVERSLVMRAPDQRYLLLETLRAFGAEQLAAGGRADLVAERHARHQVDWIEDADQHLLEPGRPVLAEIEAAIPELRSALDWLLDHDEIELAGRLITSLLDFGLLRLRPDVLAWSERVTTADPADVSPSAPRVWAVAAYAAWMAGDVTESGRCGARAVAIAEQVGAEVPPEAMMTLGNYELFEGRLSAAASWYRRAVEASDDDPAERLLASATELLALGYAGDPAAGDRGDAVLAQLADREVPHAAWAWYCAGEADLAVDAERARARLTRALELAERTNAAFVTGVAGASKASIDARSGDPVAAAEDYRRLIQHWRRAGMWSTQWTMLRSIAGLLWRLGRAHDAAVLLEAVRGTAAGHRIFGADAVALDELAGRLRATLGDDGYEAARRRGAMLDGDAAVEHALRAL